MDIVASDIVIDIFTANETSHLTTIVQLLYLPFPTRSAVKYQIRITLEIGRYPLYRGIMSMDCYILSILTHLLIFVTVWIRKNALNMSTYVLYNNPSQQN